MTIVLKSFKRVAKEIWNDVMLMAVVFVPILMGLVFKLGIPALEKYVCSYFNKTEIIAPYYLAFDLTLIIMVIMMFAFCGIMVILDELDTGIARYLVVTPLGKWGYIMSRVGILTLISMVYSVIALMFFRLSDIDLVMIIVCSLIFALINVVVSLFVVSVAHNKVEGMAICKFTGIIMIGALVPFFVTNPLKFIAGIFPTFWVAEYTLTGNFIYVIAAIVNSLLFLAYFYNRFNKRIS